MSNFVKIFQVGAELFSTDKLTHRHREREKPIVAFRDFAKKPKARQY